MRIALGAWGLGAVAAGRSAVWRQRFGRSSPRSFSVPPMSSLSPGFIELFPFLLSEHIFMDAAQYELFCSEAGRALFAMGGYHIHPDMAQLLQDLERAGVLHPIDYLSIVSPHLNDVARSAERMLDADGLAFAAAASRDLWRQFLTSPGGVFVAHRDHELAVLSGMTDPAAHAGVVPVDPAMFGGRPTMARAALQCAHDVFDVLFVQKLASTLGVEICDWQMHRPMYQELMTGPLANDGIPRDPAKSWHIPTLRSTRAGEVRRMRDDPYVSMLRQEIANLTASRLVDRGDPGALVELRREIHGHVPGVILNTYAHYETTAKQSAFVERLSSVPPPAPARASRGPFTSPPRPGASRSVFISCAQSDNDPGRPTERWLDRLLEHLAPIARRRRARVFSGRDVAPGEDHRARITREIEGASVAVLLVSSAYLASEHAYLTEVPSLLWRRHEEGLAVVPVIVNPCLFEESFFLYPDPHDGPLSISLSAFEPVNPASRPLASLPPHEQDQVLLTLVRRIDELLG